jgi:hypothetical protein
MTDLELLRKYEPVACFTQGEAFFPSAVDEYVEECSLWLTDPDGEDHMVVQYGQLSIDRLVEFEEIPEDHAMYLRFVEEPLSGLAYQKWLVDPDRERFVAPGRLARVPLLFRLADSFFDLSFIVRGKVPGGQAAAAEIKTKEMFYRDPRHVYYGRVVRSGGWIALQYLFFYTMNSWRSGFFGVNDHEADWEQVFVFLNDPEEGEPEPQWVAYASHDFKGDDLRRRWDDPLLVKEGNHPVVFAGAGSHASYFEQGEHLMGVEPAFLKPLQGVVTWLRDFWYGTLGMGSEADVKQNSRAALSVPFIDYARGDGRRIGPGQANPWSPEIISDEVGWVHNYRGLWGLDTHDLLGGERAPAGPKYNRDGNVRQSWYDPIGWAGLEKIYPPDKLSREVEERLGTLQAEIQAVTTEIETQQQVLRKQAVDVEALKATKYFDALRKKKELELKQAQNQFEDLRVRETELVEVRQALEAYARRLARGNRGSPTSHLHKVHHPEPPLPAGHRLVEIWAAMSSALILLGIVAVLILQPASWPAWLIGLALIMGFVENLVRRNLVNYLLNVIIILAIIAAGIIVIEFWQLILGLALAGVVIFIIRGNLLELRR